MKNYLATLVGCFLALMFGNFVLSLMAAAMGIVGIIIFCSIALSLLVYPIVKLVINVEALETAISKLSNDAETPPVEE